MSQLSIRHAFSSEELAFATGLTDLEICQIGKEWVLYAYSTETGGLTALSLERNASAALLDQNSAPWEGTTTGYSTIFAVSNASETLILPNSALFSTVSAQVVDPQGRFQSSQTATAPDLDMNRVLAMATAKEGSAQFLYTSDVDTGGLQGYRIGSGFEFESIAITVAPLPSAVSILQTGRDGDLLYLFAARSDVPEITTYRITSSGDLEAAGSINADTGLWASTLTELDVVKMDGNLFLFAGAAGSSSITVIKQKNNGDLETVDHVFDTLTTRYQGLDAMDLVRKKGHTYLFVAGSDDGLTVYEVTSDGRLFYQETLVDTAESYLGNITDIEALKIGGDIQIYLTSQEGAITQLDFDPGNIRQPKRGNSDDNHIKGNKKDDLLLGRGGNDLLAGGKGDDKLIDGAGVDRLKGGEGADRFIFLQDGRMDTILDFDPKRDMIDLSNIPFLYRYDDLKIKEKDWGVKITYQEETLRLKSSNDDLIAQITEDVFLFA